MEHLSWKDVESLENRKLKKRQHCVLTAKKPNCILGSESNPSDYSPLCGICKTSSPKTLTQLIKSRIEPSWLGPGACGMVRSGWGNWIYSSWNMRMLKGDHISVYRYLMAKYREDEAKLFSEVHCGRMRGTHEMQAGKFQSYIRKQPFVWLVEFFHHKHCQRRLN